MQDNKTRQMESENISRYVPLAALFAALGLIFPVFFHLVGLGSTFLPMFLPILMGSLLLPLKLALSISIVTPLLSFLFTGMPPLYPPILPVMVTELALIGAIGSFLFFHKKAPLWLTLVTAVLADRIVLFVFVFWLAPLFGLPEKAFSIAAVLHGIPGIVLIFTVIPMTFRFLKDKYPQVFRQTFTERKEPANGN
ncbi:hypothetical protein B1H10_06770 [candidate division KSB1 bacterium 4484_188]|nr:MAG: hypothetical protein B1H10_06770 [candidate division KSB1 bacterium 4484_188]